MKKKVENGTLKFWKPWIWRKTFWLFFSAHIAQERFWNWLEFIHTSEFEIQQLQNICWQLWFQNSKKSAEMKCFFPENLGQESTSNSKSFELFLPLTFMKMFSCSLSPWKWSLVLVAWIFLAFINLKHLWRSSFWKWIFAA